MECLEAIMTRRSVREYTDEPVTDDELELVLRAAMAAPSAGNRRPWRFVVVRDPERLSRLSVATPYAAPLSRAQVGIVVVADPTVEKYSGFWVIDCAAAIENALLAARASGLGGVWMGVYPVPELVESVRRTIGLPEDVVPHSMVALGHPAGSRPEVDRYDPTFVHAENW